MRTDVLSAVVRASTELLRALEPALDDVRGAGRVTGSLELVEAAELGVEVVLADPE
jgi:valyl-tRNA synthetase